MFKCPCCGSDMALRPPVEALAYLSCGSVAKRAVEALLSIYPRTITKRQLADMVYASDPNGGPDDAENSLSVSLCIANRRLKMMGWRIGTLKNKGGRGGHGVNSIGFRTVNQ